MKLKVSQFKKIASDSHTSVLKHPDGHEIKIAHAHLSPKMRGEIEAMPLHMAEGGDVLQQQAPPVDATLDQMIQQEQENLARASAVNSGMPGSSLNPVDQKPDPSMMQNLRTQAENNVAPVYNAMKEQQGMQAGMDYQNQVKQFDEINAARQKAGLPPMENRPVASPQIQAVLNANGQPSAQPNQNMMPASMDGGPQATQDPYGAEAYYQNMEQGIGNEKQGITKEASALTQQAGREATQLQKGIEQTQNLNNLYQNHVSQLNNERQSLIKDLNDRHINPNQFWEDKSMPGKLSTGLGLLLGGMGAGATGQQNPVLDLINKQIDRNIDAQKVNMSNKQNLLNANMNQFKNEYDATAMTRVMYNDMVVNQLKLAAAQSTDPLVHARAQMAIGQLEQKTAPVLAQLAMRRSMLTGAQQGHVDPATFIQYSGYVPEGQKQAAFKELGEAQQMGKAKDNIMASFDKLAQINTIGNRMGSPIQATKQVSAIRDPLIAGLSKETAGRFTESDAHMVGTLFPAAGDDAKTIALKRAQMNKLVSEKMNFPILKGIGIDPFKSSRFGSGGQSRIQESAPVVR